MGRLFLIFALLAVIVAFVAILVSVWNTIFAAGRDGLRTYGGFGKDGVMAPTGLQKAAYVALIVVLFGVATGWLGGL
ncbi:hypothetical protein [Sulfitobacter aestuariivivens]|uniref:Uncharacterized protein n=1 Tax=Sulfitobacter aestuariivivens TaxID=2766981 RepID=A0A927D076_9RHOB|nr:hypothetical protein [Sulfitobacter aestuariivivens]MBD3662645.1 hypothetical protein [Sulfitobacter aestuariivivens]